MGDKLTHLDQSGNARMVDVTRKPESDRVAVAACSVLMGAQTIALIAAGGHKKGDVLTVARLGGIMGAKRTADLIPLCHPLALTDVDVELALDVERNAVDVTARTRTFGRTGVEMEAMTAAAVAALTIYDMCKAVDRAMRITDLRLTFKSGGNSGTYEAR